MSRSQKEKQQTFREKLQSEGADSFADGPRPWEQWDESGNQGDNRVWEGTARRIYPKPKAARGFGDRLLSGLAVIALGSMIVGIAGVYFSTPSTPRQAHSTIQPPPIVASRITAPARPAKSADTATPAIAQLDTLAPPAAGIPAPPQKPQTILEPTLPTDRATPVIQADTVDRVAVETVITEGTVTTTVYTRQPAQEEPELVAMVATTAPPFTHEAARHEEAPAMAATTETTVPGQAEAPVTEPLVIDRTEIEAATAPAVATAIDSPASDTAVVEQSTETVTAAVAPPAITRDTGTVTNEPAIVEQTTEAITAPIIIAQTDAITTEPVVVEETVAAAPATIQQAGPAVTEPAVIEQTTAVPAAPDNVALTGTADFETVVVEETVAVAVAPQAEPAVMDPVVVEQTTALPAAPDNAAQAETADLDTAAIEESAQSATAAEVVALNAPATTAETAPDPAREVATATQTPVLPDAKTGKWVINLSSYTRKRTAERMLAVFRQKGVDAEVFSTTINDKPMYRIRMAGFESARSAKAEISTLEQQLGLQGAWVSKR